MRSYFLKRVYDKKVWNIYPKPLYRLCSNMRYKFLICLEGTQVQPSPGLGTRSFPFCTSYTTSLAKTSVRAPQRSFWVRRSLLLQSQKLTRLMKMEQGQRNVYTFILEIFFFHMQWTRRHYMHSWMNSFLLFVCSLITLRTRFIILCYENYYLNTMSRKLNSLEYTLIIFFVKHRVCHPFRCKWR